MKKYFFIFCLVITVSCSDGELQIEAINFDNEIAENCGTLSTSTQLLFKINDDEVLILLLDDGLLLNEVSTDTITSSIPGGSQLTYRLFDDTVNSSYFCDSIPPATPTVIENIEANAGNVLITTSTEDDITFTHTILLEGIIITNDREESIINLSTTEFARIETSIN